MGAHKFSDLMKKRFTPEQIEDIENRARRDLLEMNLQAIRKMAGKTQTQVAKAINLTQSELSRAERREDHLLSTLRRYIHALGGELRVIADFGDKTVRIIGA